MKTRQKKAITNKFIQEFIADLIKRELEIYLIENQPLAERIVDQILINKRSREKAEKTRLNLKKTLSEKWILRTALKSLWTAEPKKSHVEKYISWRVIRPGCL